MRIKVGDTVEVIAGKDRSLPGRRRRGKVIDVDPRANRVIVDGINVVKKAVRETQRVRQGGIVETPAPIDASNVMLVCTSCEERTRVGKRVAEDGTKVRVCKKCGADIEYE
ncbi:MAG: 50S ribosomal protein L24 [Armatimonadota bacterium]|nr:50S ribosomal protein L24 [Armatimonadota bacterium]